MLHVDLKSIPTAEHLLRWRSSWLGYAISQRQNSFSNRKESCIKSKISRTSSLISVTMSSVGKVEESRFPSDVNVFVLKDITSIKISFLREKHRHV